VDKKKTVAVYDVEIDAKSGLPISVKLMNAANYKPDGKGTGFEHFVFHSNYNFSKFNETDKFPIPAQAARILR
jgi:hypothetical protein